MIKFILVSLTICQISLLADALVSNKKYYLKPKVTLQSNSVKVSDLLNWKSSWNPVLYSNLRAPIQLSPEEVALKINTLARIENKLESEIEVNGNQSMIIPLTNEWGREKIELSILDFIKSEISLKEGNFILHYEGPAVLLPESEVTIAWRRFGKNIHGGKRIFPLDVFFNEKLIHSIPLSITIEERKEAWFTSHPIEAKQILKQTDVEKRSFFTSDNNFEYDTTSPIGKTALNAIPESTPIQRKQTRLLHMIERGSEVNLVFTAGNIMIKVKTRALVSGNEGDRIDLLNLSSNKKLIGKIQSQGVCLLEEHQ